MPFIYCSVNEMIKMRFVHKPIEVEAIQYNGDNKKEIIEFTNGDTLTELFPGHYIIGKGDWIVKKDNKFYLYPPEIFEKTFDRID